jgi:DNA (cytosine-5)-methyltransferase 1
LILDLFAGAGGVDLGARYLGLETYGIELDASACATRMAAGFWTLRGDIAAMNPTKVMGGVK